MKRGILGLISLLVWMPWVRAAPDVTMSFDSASSGGTITASEHNTVRNETASKFNSHTHTDITSNFPIGDRVQRTAGDVTTTSATLATITGLSITLTTHANPVVLGFTGACRHSDISTNIYMNFAVDGTAVLGVLGQPFEVDIANENFNCSVTAMTADVTAGSHTFTATWATGAATATMNCDSNEPCTFWVAEVYD